MAAPKLYPHQVKLNRLLRDKSISLSDIDDPTIQRLITTFQEKTQGRYNEDLVATSWEICEEIDDWLDEQADDDEPVVTLPAPAAVPVTKPAPPPAAKSQSAKVLLKDRMTPNDAVLDKFYKQGRTEGLTLEELKKEGFETGLFNMNLDSTGWHNGKYYELKKGRNEKVYQIIRLRNS